MAAVQAGYPDVVVAQANLAEASLVPGPTSGDTGPWPGWPSISGRTRRSLRWISSLRMRPITGTSVKARRPLPGHGGRVRPGGGPAGAGSGRGRRPPPSADRAARARARPCWRNGCPGCCRTLPTTKPWRSQPSIRSAAFPRPPVQLLRRPPFENPHHSATAAAIIGGGSGLPRPGAASRAHRGVLFLDEAPEYERRVLDALRQPLESGELVIHRSAGTAAYPARFQLVLAANPCPCGKASGKGLDCTCTPMMRRRYLARMSGPLLDRVDIQLQVERVSLADFGQAGAEEDTAAVAARVCDARTRQAERLRPLGLETNSQVPGRILRGGFAAAGRGHPDPGPLPGTGRADGHGATTGSCGSPGRWRTCHTGHPGHQRHRPGAGPAAGCLGRGVKDE